MATKKSTKKSTAKKESSQKKAAVALTLSVGDTTLRSEGETIADALLNLPPDYVKSKAVLEVKQGSKMYTTHVFPNMIRKARASRNNAEIHAKRLGRSLKVAK